MSAPWANGTAGRVAGSTLSNKAVSPPTCQPNVLAVVDGSAASPQPAGLARLASPYRPLPPRSYGKCGDFIQQHRKGLIELAPGCDADQSLEAAVTGVLNNIREQAAKVGGGWGGRGCWWVVAVGQG